MYWWHHAAFAVASGRTLRAGLITTNSIVQPHNRSVISKARDRGAHVVWAVPNHPWVDGVDGAAVRVAFTVISAKAGQAVRITVDDDANIVDEKRVARLNDDLTVHADVATAAKTHLRANSGLSSQGFKLHGSGFLLEGAEARALLAGDPSLDAFIKPYRGGRDITARARDIFVIDFGLMDHDEVRQCFVLYGLLRDRVKPERDASKRATYARYWWRFGEPRRELREATAALSQFIATVYVAKHRFFTFMPARVVTDDGVVCIASDDPFVLGVLSSRIHEAWALAAGGRMGVGDTPRYNNSLCFAPFPLPDANQASVSKIRTLAERIEAHRRHVLRSDARVTMTGMYNVLCKLRDGAMLDEKERAINAAAACGVLLELHDELDSAVAEAYGWSWPEPPALILERLVALHDRRVEEEAGGTIRWLRPEYQRPRFGVDVADANPAPTLDLPATTATVAGAATVIVPAPWPSDAIGQITVLRSMAAMTPVSIEEAVQRLVGAKRDIVHRHLETLAMLGEVRDVGGGRYAVAAGSV
jgi:hypothetical protein